MGEISESDVQLAAASKATIIGFHTAIEAHAEPMVKGLGVSVRFMTLSTMPKMMFEISCGNP